MENYWLLCSRQTNRICPHLSVTVCHQQVFAPFFIMGNGRIIPHFLRDNLQDVSIQLEFPLLLKTIRKDPWFPL